MKKVTVRVEIEITTRYGREIEVEVKDDATEKEINAVASDVALDDFDPDTWKDDEYDYATGVEVFHANENGVY